MAAIASEETAKISAIATKSGPGVPMQTHDGGQIDRKLGLIGEHRGAIAGRQISILFASDWQLVCSLLGSSLTWLSRRANLLISDMQNPRHSGGILQIGTAQLVITGELLPCSRMDREFPGLRLALQPDWRGGVVCSVRVSGKFCIGDAVILQQP